MENKECDLSFDSDHKMEEPPLTYENKNIMKDLWQN
jgi:hypothetical protein